MNNKYKNTVVVEVQENFPEKGKTLFKKGTKHAIRKELLDKLKSKGLKTKKIDVDFKEAELKAREKFLDSKENQGKKK